MEPIEIDEPFFKGVKDFTFFIERDKLPDALKEKLNGKHHCDETVRLKSKDRAESVVGRLNASWCFQEEFVSCSFRATSRISDSMPEYHSVAYNTAPSFFNPAPPGENPTTSFIFSLEELCQEICEVIFKATAEPASVPHGLIIISGATATGKSEIARGLIYKYLTALVRRAVGRCERRPHLVTVEDPIDKSWATNPEAARATGIDYTPREVVRDVSCLQEAVDAALRQTPALLFVGETRKEDDWKELLRFGATGHLGLTTSHAGSLTEAMGHLLQAAKADSPARRSQIASRILALVHLRSEGVTYEGRDSSTIKKKMTLPAVWSRSSTSLKTLMADGLTSLLPYQTDELGCVGRSWFAEKLLRSKGDPESGRDTVIKKKALEWDLEGI